MKRFTFGGAILNKEYQCVPPKAKIQLLTAEQAGAGLHQIQALQARQARRRGQSRHTPDEQIVELADLPVQTPKQLGTLISHRAVDWLKTTRPRGWNETGGPAIGPLFN